MPEKLKYLPGKIGRAGKATFRARLIPLSWLLILSLIIGSGYLNSSPAISRDCAVANPESGLIQLPAPRHDSQFSLEKALKARQSVREYQEVPLTMAEISQILWAAQGFTRERKEPPTRWNPKYEWQGGLRTAPSAGALYPMEIYLLAGKVDGLPGGVYKYVPKNHALIKVTEADKRKELCLAALKQPQIEKAPAVILMAGVYERTSYKYGERAERYVHMEAGSIAENIYLQATALGIGTVLIGAFNDEEVKKVMALPADESPLVIMPLGRMPAR
ncbi:MAG: SagB/ThcOx family dehydrogenase [Candidatus Saccharicenans sp.]|jgi:SagB-type dehydrogenase family enzyme|nr:SagB/ThcOx family dehydrogenase [Candidatus Saccharicenans sp.]MDH7574721.1 SagB/ThcOx family dehydrogenase [Candidatus Saccharicenans sp.]NPV82607.1 SagB/ThcOx family dehydrogenase [Candidatus Aminicenantes bacterium]